MTTQVHTAGPGVEDYRSLLYSASVNGTEAYVYGWARTAEFDAPQLWLEGDEATVSFFTYGADEETTVIISAVSGSVTSCEVFPKAHGITATVGGGTATIVISTSNLRKPLRIHINGDKANPLYIHPHGLKTAVPGGAITYDESQNKVTTGTCLRFPAGVWDLADSAHGSNLKFPIESNSVLYLDEGAVVIGTFSLVPSSSISSNVTICGPGIISGEFVDNEDISAEYSEGIQYALIFGELLGQAGTGNTIKECTLIRSPFYSIGGTALNEIIDLHVYNPWTNNSDGIRGIGDSNASNIWHCTNCSIWTGDDALVIEHFARHGVVDNLFTMSSYSAAIQLGYQAADIDYGWTTNITNSFCLALQYYYISSEDGPEGGAVIQCWVDETLSSHGRHRVTIDNLKVESDVILCPIFNIKNKQYPWGTYYLKKGNISDFVLSNIEVESVPSTLSIIKGLDASNTPHDITISNLIIGGTLVTEVNKTDYISINDSVYNLYIYGIDAQEVIVSSDFISGSSVSIILAGESDLIFGSCSIPNIEQVITGTGTIVTVNSYADSIVTIPTVTASVTNIPTSIDPTQLPFLPENISVYGNAYDQYVVVPGLDDYDTVRIINKLYDIKNDVKKLPNSERATWSQNVIENINVKSTGQDVVKIMTSNYNKFGKIRNRPAAKK